VLHDPINRVFSFGDLVAWEVVVDVVNEWACGEFEVGVRLSTVSAK
jgi:hypothetical protein